MKMKCPVCGNYEFEEYDDYDICPVCNWENDGLQYNNHNYAGGANDLSINEARIEYFVMNHPQTANQAAMAKEKYENKQIAIYRKYAKKLNRKEMILSPVGRSMLISLVS